MLEALKSPLEELSGGKSLMAILSNYATEALVTATSEIDIRFLDRNKSEALDNAKKIVLAKPICQARSLSRQHPQQRNLQWD